jgi:hypothetical protein
MQLDSFPTVRTLSEDNAGTRNYDVQHNRRELKLRTLRLALFLTRMLGSEAAIKAKNAISDVTSGTTVTVPSESRALRGKQFCSSLQSPPLLRLAEQTEEGRETL